MALATLDWRVVRQHYDEREAVHRRLATLHKEELVQSFVDLAIGKADPNGNYSAAEHGIGPKILATNLNAQQRIYDLATQFLAVKRGLDVPQLIRNAGLAYLQIGVGSEMSCILNPARCWVANTRTIWAHLLVKHNDNYGKADEELSLYRDNDASSEMAYRIWVEIHKILDTAMTRLAAMGARLRADLTTRLQRS